MTAYRSGDTGGIGDHAPLWRRAFWPVVDVAVVRRRRLPCRTRSALLRAFGAQLDGTVVIGPDVGVTRPWSLRVDGPAWIGEGARIAGPVYLQRDTCVAAGAHLGGDGSGPIRIGAGAWVGPRARVLPGAEIGDGAVVAERAVVAGRVEAGRTVTTAAVPGRS